MKKAKLSARLAFAQALRRIRSDMGLSQEALGELCGLHRTYIGSVERGERNIAIDNIEKIALALKTPLHKFLGGSRS